MIVVWLLRLVLIYLAVGVAFALPFLTHGIFRLDPAAKGSHPAFRFLILPGVVALWPVLAVKWKRVGQREPHS